MKPVTIELNTGSLPYFTLPGKLHLTYENPGPVSIDPEELSQEEKTWINQAARAGTLIVANPNKKAELPKVEATSVSQPQPAAKEVSLPATEANPKREEMLAGVRKLLSGKVSAANKAIETSDDILFLRLLRETEAAGKNRKAILAKVNDKISEIQSSIATSFSGAAEENTSQYYAGSGLAGMFANLPEVEEEIERTIEIRPLSPDDE